MAYQVDIVAFVNAEQRADICGLIDIYKRKRFQISFDQRNAADRILTAGSVLMRLRMTSSISDDLALAVIMS